MPIRHTSVQNWVNNGRFEVKGYGDKVDAMKKAFQFYNALLDRYQGNAVGIAEFLDEKYNKRPKENEFIKEIEKDYVKSHKEFISRNCRYKDKYIWIDRSEDWKWVLSEPKRKLCQSHYG